MMDQDTTVNHILTLNHWIGGQEVPPSSNTYLDDLNPVDDSVYARFARGNAKDMDQAVQVAHEAFQSFRHMLAKDREALLCKAAALLEEQQQEFIDILIDEVGSPIMKARFEVSFCLSFLRAAAGVPRRMKGETLPSDMPGRFSMSVREPVGVVAGITPFNVPMIKGVKQSAMAVATGNTMVLLPSEEAPRLALRLAKLWNDAGLPQGVFNVVTGNGAEIGDALTGHPLVRAITFTGSSRVGKHIAELAAKDLKKYTLELGGKSPLIVFADADLPAAVRAAVMGMFMYQGQVCMGSSRIFVERQILPSFCEAFAAAAKNLKSGDLRDPATVLAPIINKRQRERVRTHIEDAKAKGANLLAGGEFMGNQCKATIFADVTPDMILYREETFGPVTSVYAFDTMDEAIAKANDTDYGLSAAVFTQDISKALTVAQAVQSGMVHINAPSLHDEPHVPFGGIKNSGFGREGTDADLELMTEWKWITVQLPGAATH
jgi:acyl-CoA reductase-like NAD-dependent aldehyde dehydrogenase